MNIKKIAGIICIMTFVIWGCKQNADEKQSNQPSLKSQQVPEPVPQQQVPVQTQTQTGEADQYGRLPGDEHYGHSHSTEIQQNQLNTQQNLNSGADQYGRLPGDEHYGHDHAPAQTQQQNLNGGPDKFGRNPGDEHYGHDHE